MAGRYGHGISLNPDAPHQMILARCRNAQSVLDVGCWSGSLGRLLLASGVRLVDGIEVDAVAGARAAIDYRKVWVADVEALELPDVCRYDRIVCADVLEHTRNPYRVLSRLRSHLASGGLLVISIPNVAHWSLRAKLLLGRWDYTDRGLLDRTHLHFFTLRSVKADLEAAGYRVTEVAISPLIHPFIRTRSLTSRLGRLWPTGFAYQFVITAAARIL